MDSRWTSRKFLMTLATQVAAVAVLIWPQRGQAITEGAQGVVALVVMLLSALGYVHAEASVDRANSGAAGSGADRGGGEGLTG